MPKLLKRSKTKPARRGGAEPVRAAKAPAAPAAKSAAPAARPAAPVVQAPASKMGAPAPLFQGPAIALLELESIARGYVVADALVKKAPVKLLLTEPVTPGKFLILIDGEVADVEESFKEGLEVAGPGLLDKLFLAQASAQLAPAIRGTLAPLPVESLGVVETHSVASALLAADVALKAAEVKLVRMQLARGIGGKGYFVLTGELDMIEAAVGAAAAAIAPELLVTTEVIARPHADLAAR